jgi:hypothetical protein
MSITTYADFVDQVRDLSVTGVTRPYEHPPVVLNTSDLPASWPSIPLGEEPMVTAKTAGGWATLTCDLTIAVEPVGQSTQPTNYALMITLMDNLSTALRGSIGTIGRGPVLWEMRGSSQIRVGDVAYWGVIATVTAY